MGGSYPLLLRSVRVLEVGKKEVAHLEVLGTVDTVGVDYSCSLSLRNINMVNSSEIRRCFLILNGRSLQCQCLGTDGSLSTMGKSSGQTGLSGSSVTSHSHFTHLKTCDFNRTMFTLWNKNSNGCQAIRSVIQDIMRLRKRIDFCVKVNPAV